MEEVGRAAVHLAQLSGAAGAVLRPPLAAVVRPAARQAAASGRLRAQRRFMRNPYIENHQTTETQCFPARPQPKVIYTGGHTLRVGYILQREAVVTPEVHPLQRSFEALADEEYTKYPRSAGNISEVIKKELPDASKSLQSGMQPYWKEPRFQQQELSIMRTFRVGRRLTPADIEDTTQRHTLQRRLQERLFFIVRDAKTGAWRFPEAVRAQGESLRSTVDRALLAHHRGAIETFMPTNAPAGYVRHSDTETTHFFQVFYLTGMPVLPVEGSDEHAWVTRHELREYRFSSIEYKRAAYASCHDPILPRDVPIFAN
eukprot:TRINITY_DN27629_c0_g1_i1.p2 TRINITY_DN27629_c0_g1~~TRINITY_DN27629_c0_g1_i1.p2  ORF type:complete len:315 (+),score=64.49 TRINITY_DN27629_c0_g1_i1:70-1014(+)